MVSSRDPDCKNGTYVSQKLLIVALIVCFHNFTVASYCSSNLRCKSPMETIERVGKSVVDETSITVVTEYKIGVTSLNELLGQQAG